MKFIQKLDFAINWSALKILVGTLHVDGVKNIDAEACE
jgi:hypothetical protein